mmetsp:Transcript_78397/g.217745  ORF Transcript_78397/g.217745 Transcript_78397/m.217745 type:complete len:266 (+) Transcript_78397:334-1131(+)
MAASRRRVPRVEADGQNDFQEEGPSARWRAHGVSCNSVGPARGAVVAPGHVAWLDGYLGQRPRHFRFGEPPGRGCNEHARALRAQEAAGGLGYLCLAEQRGSAHARQALGARVPVAVAEALRPRLVQTGGFGRTDLAFVRVARVAALLHLEVATTPRLRSGNDCLRHGGPRLALGLRRLEDGPRHTRAGVFRTIPPQQGEKPRRDVDRPCVRSGRRGPGPALGVRGVAHAQLCGQMSRIAHFASRGLRVEARAAPLGRFRAQMGL